MIQDEILYERTERKYRVQDIINNNSNSTQTKGANNAECCVKAYLEGDKIVKKLVDCSTKLDNFICEYSTTTEEEQTNYDRYSKFNSENYEVNQFYQSSITGISKRINQQHFVKYKFPFSFNNQTFIYYGFPETWEVASQICTNAEVDWPRWKEVQSGTHCDKGYADTEDPREYWNRTHDSENWKNECFRPDKGFKLLTLDSMENAKAIQNILDQHTNNEGERLWLDAIDHDRSWLKKQKIHICKNSDEKFRWTGKNQPIKDTSEIEFKKTGRGKKAKVGTGCCLTYNPLLEQYDNFDDGKDQLCDREMRFLCQQNDDLHIMPFCLNCPKNFYFDGIKCVPIKESDKIDGFHPVFEFDHKISKFPHYFEGLRLMGQITCRYLDLDSGKILLKRGSVCSDNKHTSGYESIIGADTVRKVAEESLEVDLSDLDIKTLKNVFLYGHHSAGCSEYDLNDRCCYITSFYETKFGNMAYNGMTDYGYKGWTLCSSIVTPSNENDFNLHYTKYMPNHKSIRGAKIFSVSSDVPESMFTNFMIAKHLPFTLLNVEYLSYGDNHFSTSIPMSKHLLYGMTELKVLELIRTNVHLTAEHFISNINLESIIIQGGS